MIGMATHNPRHNFNFEGGDLLHTMGASWFVSYHYNLHIDRGHINWQKVSTYRNRMSVYNGSKRYHRFFLSQIVGMNEGNLSKNTLGLSGLEVKQMAKRLLTHLG
jgi:hypothetical protein